MRRHRDIRWRQFAAGNGPAREWPGYEVRKPTRSPSVAADVAVPFLQSLVSALVVGTAATVILWGFWGTPIWPTTWPIATAAAFIGSWLWRLDAASATLWQIETWLDADIDADGVVGEPADHDHIILSGPRPSPPSANERKRAAFIRFIRGVAATGDGGYERWEADLGRERYLEFRRSLLTMGWAKWNDPGNHRLGWALAPEHSAEKIIEKIR